MNVNLDADISNILFLEYMKKKDNENGEQNLLLVGEQSTNKPILKSKFDFPKSIPHP